MTKISEKENIQGVTAQMKYLQGMAHKQIRTLKMVGHDIFLSTSFFIPLTPFINSYRYLMFHCHSQD
jgi:hypothetical protein